MLPKMSGIFCPACGNELTEKEVKDLWGLMLSRSLKGRVSEKKKRTSAENGKKGGRPKKKEKR